MTKARLIYLLVITSLLAYYLAAVVSVRHGHHSGGTGFSGGTE